MKEIIVGFVLLFMSIGTGIGCVAFVKEGSRHEPNPNQVFVGVGTAILAVAGLACIGKGMNLDL